MLKPTLNLGLIFRNLPAKCIAALHPHANNYSEASCIKGFIEMLNPDAKTDSEHQFFRDIRNNNDDMGKFLEGLKTLLKLPVSFIPKYNLTIARIKKSTTNEDFGSWFFIECVIQGCVNSNELDKELKNYLFFIQAHCKLERDLFHLVSTEQQGKLEKFIEAWYQKPAKDSEVWRIDLFNTIYWIVLFEKFVNLSFPESGALSYEDYLPSTSKGKIIYASEIGFRKLKAHILDAENIKPTNQNLYDIAAKETGRDLDNIKKGFDRLRAGKTPFTAKNISKLSGVNIAGTSNSYSCFGISLLDITQRENFNHPHINNDYLLATYKEEYCRAKTLLDKNFDIFSSNSELSLLDICSI